MAISKSTPYVRYKKDFTSSLHLGTIHIESEYLDRTQKTTIESIHGMTWHNKVVNENKELNLLSDTQLELTELEKQYWNTGEKRVSVDEIHTLEEVEPNEDGTYTYTVNSMEGEYIEIYDGINNITSTSDGLDGQFEIVYDTTEEDINGNIALDQVVSQYEITDSGVGAIIGAKSTGLTLVNNITESSKEEVVAIGEYEGKHFTIENTVQGNIKSAVIKGDTLVNLCPPSIYTASAWVGDAYKRFDDFSMLEKGKRYTFYSPIISKTGNAGDANIGFIMSTDGIKKTLYGTWGNSHGTIYVNFTMGDALYFNNYDVYGSRFKINYPNTIILEGDYTQEEIASIPYFEGIQSVKMPVLTTTGKNLFDGIIEKGGINAATGLDTTWSSNFRTSFMRVPKNNTNFLFTFNYKGLQMSGGYLIIIYYNENKERISSQTVGNREPFNFNQDAYYYRITQNISDNVDILDITNIQLEEGTVATSYEPYKSNILTVNEEVELRGIGDVKDELNLETGELVQNFGSLYFDGSENWNIYNRFGDMAIAKLNLPNLTHNFTMNTSLSDKIPVVAQAWTGVKGISLLNQDVHIAIEQSLANTNDDLKNWMSSIGGINLIYRLPQSTVKTVDLTVQNQDGNTIPHIQTQPTTTHVSTSSDGLVPTVEMSCSYDTIIKPNTTYTIKLDRPIVSDTMYLQVDLGGTMMMLDADVNAFTIKTPSTLSHSQLRLSGTGNTVKEIIVLEGNRVNDKIEYFEGMKNVENPILVVSNCQYVFGKGGRI